MVELLPFSMAERWGNDPPARWEDVAFTGLYPPVHSRPVEPHDWHAFSKRLVKTPKLYFHDTGLASWLLGVQHAAQWETHPLRGALFENLIISEIWKARAHSGQAMNIHFWRDHAGHEVDVLLDQAGTLVPVEIKSGETVRSDWLGDLEHFRAIAGDASGQPRLVYGGGDGGVRKGVEILSWRYVQALARLAAGDMASSG